MTIMMFYIKEKEIYYNELYYVRYLRKNRFAINMPHTEDISINPPILYNNVDKGAIKAFEC